MSGQKNRNISAALACRVDAERAGVEQAAAQQIDPEQAATQQITTHHTAGRKLSNFFAHLVLGLTLAILVVAAWGAISPQAALAQSYAIARVDISATVQSNGDLRVQETRTYDIDGSFTSVDQSFTNLPNNGNAQINSVEVTMRGETRTLSHVPFELEWRTSGGPDQDAYSFDYAQKTLYLFFSAHDESVSVTLDYTVPDAVNVYRDIGELYWQFIGADWPVDSRDVSCTIALPVSAGEEVLPGENVYAWGHGPLATTVEISPDGVVSYDISQVSAGTFAESRIAMPESWLGEVAARDSNAHPNESRLEAMLTEEQRWSDQANMQKTSMLMSSAAAVFLTLVALVWGAVNFKRYGKALEQASTEEQISASPETSQSNHIEAYTKEKRSLIITVGVLLLVACVLLGYVFNNYFAVIPGVIGTAALFLLGRYMNQHTQKSAS